MDLNNLERIPRALFFTSITSILAIIAIIILGYFFQVKGWLGDDFGLNLSSLIMNVALPVSIFVTVMKYLTLDKLISFSVGLLYWKLVWTIDVGDVALATYSNGCEDLKEP